MRIEAEHICQKLKNDNIKIWFDTDYSSGVLHKFDDSISALRNSYLFVCFTSKEYMKNIKCRMEFYIAVEQKINIVNLKMEEMEFDLIDRNESIAYNEFDFFMQEAGESLTIFSFIKELAKQAQKNYFRAIDSTVSSYFETLE